MKTLKLIETSINIKSDSKMRVVSLPIGQHFLVFIRL